MTADDATAPAGRTAGSEVPLGVDVLMRVDEGGSARLLIDSEVMSQAVYLYRPVLGSAGEVVDLEIVMLNDAARRMPFSDGMSEGALASDVFVDMQLALDAANAVVRGDAAEPYSIERVGLLEAQRLVVRYDVSTFRVEGPGGVVHIGQTALDRTWMTQAAEADVRFRLMAEASHDGLLLLTSDRDGALLVEFANPAIRRNDPRIRSGYPLPADLARFARGALVGLPVGSVVRREHTFESSPRRAVVDVVFTRLNEAQVLVTVRELTSEQLARAELERSDALLGAIARGAFGTLVVYEADVEHGRVVGLRPSWSARGHGQPTGRRPLDPEIVPQQLLIDAVNELRSDHRPAHFGWLTVSDDGGAERSIEFALVPAGDRFVLEFVERTEELALRTELATVTAAAEAQRSFLSRISHELRSPLNVIHGYTQLLSRMQLPGVADHHVEHIDRGVRRMVSVVDDLLLLGHLDQGLLSLELRTVVLDEVVDEVWRKVRSSGRGVEERLARLAPAGAVVVRTDPSRVSEALAATILACLEFDDTSRVEIGPYVRGTTVGLQVAASSDASMVDGIWRPFVGGRTLPGNGLELAVARALLLALGLEAEVRASVGAAGERALVVALDGAT